MSQPAGRPASPAHSWDTARTEHGRLRGLADRRRSRGRRAWPMAVFVLVLAIAAAAVWIRIFSDDNRTATLTGPASCRAATPALSAHLVVVRVYNSTERAGLAARTTKALRDRGFDVVTTANDPVTTRRVSGVGEVRFGPAGAARARIIAAAVPGARLVTDGRATTTVDVALGPSFRAVAPAGVVSAVVKAVDRESASSCAG